MCAEANPKAGLLFSFRRVITVLGMFYMGLLPFLDIPETHFEIPGTMGCMQKVVKRAIITSAKPTLINKRGIPNLGCCILPFKSMLDTHTNLQRTQFGLSHPISIPCLTFEHGMCQPKFRCLSLLINIANLHVLSPIRSVQGGEPERAKTDAAVENSLREHDGNATQRHPVSFMG